MKSQLNIKKALITALFVIIGTALFAQTGKISGKVSDKKSGETLIGVTVKIKDTNRGMATDVDGKYSLTGLAAGKYTLIFQYVGYNGKEISDVEVTNGKSTIFDIILDEAGGQSLSEVVIQGSFKKESVNALYATQKNSASISDGISSEAIKRSPDRNTSDVLKRVSGATIQDNKFVVIRGLGDRYNTAMLDNSALPSTEPNRKAFSFDIVPSNLVDNLIISKTATPDLPGDFTGGAIQITTKDVPEQNFISIGGGVGYNTVSTFKDFYSGPRNATDYFGFDNGNRKLKSTFPSTTRLSAGLTPEQNIRAIRTLPQDWSIYNSSALPTQNYQFTIGRIKEFKESDKKLGAILSLTYRNSQSINGDALRDFYEYDYSDDTYKFSTNVGALANFAYTAGKNKITFKNIYNRIYEDMYTSRTGINNSNGTDNKFFAFDVIQKSLFKSTIEGNHQLGALNSKINWSVGFSNVLNDQPDQRKINYTKNVTDLGNPEIGYTANVLNIGKENTRLFSKLNENGYNGAVNYSLPVNMFKQKSTLKVGLASSYRDRSFDVRFLGLELGFNNEDVEAIRQRPLSTLFGKDLIDRGIYKLSEIPNSGDIYTADALTNSAYAMLDNKLGEKARVVWGVRAESFNLNLETLDPANAPVKQDYLDILPSANFTYSLTEKINLRASYYRTLARPEFRELAPFQYYDYEQLAFQQGNPNLKRAQINNADLRFELYPSAGQIFSVSAFYKQFSNAIESLNEDYNSTRTITYFNSNKAEVYGLEFEIRKTLDFIAQNDFMKNTTAYANLALIKSKVTNPENTGVTFIESSRQMVGQAPYTVNAGLQHTFLNDKMNFNVLYNRVGRRILAAGGSRFPSIWEAPRNVVDLQLGMKVLNKKGELKFNAGDILNNNTTFYYDMDMNEKYEANGQDETINRYKLGSNYSVSFSYTF
ncbi:TonB-dependent receptor [Pedobacter psychroterrae]|uniref:TonB-dependent receptor n=1 Tax=Pedobacter psychroterrae TaxID=2530453 RepID=A0A4R0NS95_9SPHI|nr:TonB-dependent receptor [Pedobacter psychroterrae]TCD03786.1 TonB-dependent receptor [Pedobacter psychroterrae]